MRGQDRAVQVLAAAAEQPRWRDACVCRFGAGYRLSAEDVTGCFELVVATIEDAVTGLLTRRADLLGAAPGASDAPSAPRDGSGGSPSAFGDDLDVVTVGGLGALPPRAGRGDAGRGQGFGRARSQRRPGATDGVPIVVTVDGSHRPEVLVDVQVYGHDDHISVRIPLRDDPPPDGYHVGVQVARTGLGVFVLRPVTGGQAQVLPLPENMRPPFMSAQAR